MRSQERGPGTLGSLLVLCALMLSGCGGDHAPAETLPPTEPPVQTAEPTPSASPEVLADWSEAETAAAEGY